MRGSSLTGRIYQMGVESIGMRSKESSASPLVMLKKSMRRKRRSGFIRKSITVKVAWSRFMKNFHRMWDIDGAKGGEYEGR